MRSTLAVIRSLIQPSITFTKDWSFSSAQYSHSRFEFKEQVWVQVTYDGRTFTGFTKPAIVRPLYAS